MVYMRLTAEDITNADEIDYYSLNKRNGFDARSREESVRRYRTHKITRKIICWILGILVGVVLAIGTLLSGIYMGPLNKSVVFRSLHDSDYYANTLEYFYESSYDLTLPSGLPVDVLADAVTLEQVQKDVNGYIESCFDGSQYYFDTSSLKDSVRKASVKYMKEKYPTQVNVDNSKMIDAFVREVSTQYESTISVTVFVYIGSFHNMLQNIVPVVALFAVMILVAVCFLVAKLHTYFHRGLRYAAYGTLSAMIMTGVVPAILLIIKPYLKLGISPDFFNKFVMIYIHNSLWVLIYSSMVLLVISIFLILVINILRTRLIMGFGRTRTKAEVIVNR